MSCPANADGNWCNRMQWNRMLCLLLYVSTYVCMYVCAVSVCFGAENINEFHDFGFLHALLPMFQPDARVPEAMVASSIEGHKHKDSCVKVCDLQLKGLEGLYGCVYAFKRIGIKYPHQTPPVCTQVVDNIIQHTIVHLILKSPLEVWTILSTFTWVFFRCGDLLFRCVKSPFEDFCLAFPNHSRMFSNLLSNVSFKWNPLSIKNNLEALSSSMHTGSNLTISLHQDSQKTQRPALDLLLLQHHLLRQNFLKSSTMAQQKIFIVLRGFLHRSAQLGQAWKLVLGGAQMLPGTDHYCCGKRHLWKWALQIHIISV